MMLPLEMGLPPLQLAEVLARRPEIRRRLGVQVPGGAVVRVRPGVVVAHPMTAAHPLVGVEEALHLEDHLWVAVEVAHLPGVRRAVAAVRLHAAPLVMGRDR